MKNANVKKSWSKEELVICFYVSKWGLAGLNVDQQDIVDTVIKDATIGSFKMQVANFNFLLGIDARQLKHVSKLQIQISEELKNYTSTQVRKLVLGSISRHQKVIDKSVITRFNDVVNAKMKKANEALTEVFNGKLKSLRRYRNLTPVESRSDLRHFSEEFSQKEITL